MLAMDPLHYELKTQQFLRVKTDLLLYFYSQRERHIYM